MTDRISSFQSSPATTFYLECDVVETQASYGSSGRWRLRFYIRAINGPGGTTGSSYLGPGTQLGQRSQGSTWKSIISHSPNPFLPAGYANNQQRWRGGPVDEWVVANDNGYWYTTLTSMPLRMHLDYGNVDVYASGSIPIPRIARAPGAPGTPSGSSIGTTSATVSWSAADRGNAAISRYEWQISLSSTFSSPIGGTINAGTATSDTVSGLTPATQYYMRVRAVNGDGTGSWSSTGTLTTTPAAPTTPTVSNVTTTSMMLSWTDSNGPQVTGYDLQYATSSSFSGATTIALGDVSSRTVSGLTPGTTYYWRVRAKDGSVVSSWSGTRTQATDPGAPPSAPTFSAITPTSVTVSWGNPPGNQGGITGFEYQLSTNSGFTAVVATISVGKVNSDNTANDVTLNPGTQYWVRVRAKMGSVVSAWSPTGNFTTLSSSPPSFIIVPAASGRAATLTMTPPPGITTVDQYQVERRVKGTTTPVTSATTTTNTLTMTNLTPGQTYEYRVRAVIGSYTSPYSAWQERRQPQPSTNPGDYFDGSSAATENETFRWTGTTNNSTSEVVGTAPLNWKYAESVNGGVGVVTRVVGGYVGDYAARMLVTLGATGAGMRWGQELTSAPSDVVPLATYYGSVYVSPSRDQRLSAEITWLTNALTVAGRDVNEGVLCPAVEWTRLSVSGAAPANADFALVRIIDVTGTGWSVWQSGEYVYADAAMLTLDDLFPYFDGDTADSDEYTYAWEGAPHNAESSRTIVSVPDAPLIRDPDCPPPPTPPRPPAIMSDCIEETGVWRRYWSMIPSYEVSTMLYVLPAIRVTTQAYALRQLRVRFYQAPQGVDDPNAIDPNTWISEMVVSYVPANTVLLLDSVEQRATASVGGSASTDAGHLLYGSNGAPVIWPILNCGANYFVSFDTPVTVPIGNQTFEAVLTQRY